MSHFKSVSGRGDFAAALSDAGDKLVLYYYTDNQAVDSDSNELEPLELVASEYQEELVYLLVAVKDADECEEYSFPAVFYTELPSAVIYRHGARLAQLQGPCEEGLKMKIEKIKSGDDDVEDVAVDAEEGDDNGKEENGDDGQEEQGEEAVAEDEEGKEEEEKKDEEEKTEEEEEKKDDEDEATEETAGDNNVQEEGQEEDAGNNNEEDAASD